MNATEEKSVDNSWVRKELGSTEPKRIQMVKRRVT